MSRIIIFGNAGSGKSTFASSIGKKLDIPVYHLDDVFSDDTLRRLSHELMLNKLRPIIATPHWVIDGDYRGQLPEDRVDAADKIFWLDVPTIVSFYRVVRRFIRCELGLDNRAGLRPDQKNRLTLKFLYWVLWKYPRSSKGKMLEVVRQRCPEKIVFLRSFQEMNKALSEL